MMFEYRCARFNPHHDVNAETVTHLGRKNCVLES